MDSIKLTKILSGYFFFYSDIGAPTLINIEMNDAVNCAILQKAFDRAVVRYPYFKTQIVWKDGDIYLAQNSRPMVVGSSEELRRLGSKELGYHLLEVHGYDHTIGIQFHHGIADGNGVMPFIRTLLYSYLCEYYGRDFNAPLIIKPDSQIDPKEYTEPIGEQFYPETGDVHITRPEHVYGLPELQEKAGLKQCYFTHIRFPMKEFVSYMKHQDASPAILISLLFSMAIDRVHPDHDGEIVANLVWNFRKELGMTGSHNDSFSSIFLKYDEKLKQIPFDLQGTCFRGMTFAQTKENDAYIIANQLIGLRKKAEEYGGYEGKFRFLYSVLSRSHGETVPVSYTGQMQMGECEQKIADMFIYPTGTYTIGVEVSSVNDSLSIDIQMNNDISVYSDAFCDILKEKGIPFERKPIIKIDFPVTNASMIEEAKTNPLSEM